MKLDLVNKFELDINNGVDIQTITGTFKPVSKAIKKQLKENHKPFKDKQKKLNKIQSELKEHQSNITILNYESNINQVIKYNEDLTKDISKEEAKKRLDEATKAQNSLAQMKEVTEKMKALRNEAEQIQEDLEDYNQAESESLAILKECVSTEQKDLVNICINAVGGLETLQAIKKAVDEGKQQDIKN